MKMMMWLTPAAGAAALLFALALAVMVRRQEMGNERMREIAGAIKEGARAFLGAEYRMLAVFVAVLSAQMQAVCTRAALSIKGSDCNSCVVIVRSAFSISWRIELSISSLIDLLHISNISGIFLSLCGSGGENLRDLIALLPSRSKR